MKFLLGNCISLITILVLLPMTCAQSCFGYDQRCSLISSDRCYPNNLKNSDTNNWNEESCRKAGCCWDNNNCFKPDDCGSKTHCPSTCCDDRKFNDRWKSGLAPPSCTYPKTSTTITTSSTMSTTTTTESSTSRSSKTTTTKTTTTGTTFTQTATSTITLTTTTSKTSTRLSTTTASTTRSSVTRTLNDTSLLSVTSVVLEPSSIGDLFIKQSTTQESSSSSSSSGDTPMIIAIIVVLLLIVVAIVVTSYCLRKRKHKEPEVKLTPNPMYRSGSIENAPRPTYDLPESFDPHNVPQHTYDLGEFDTTNQYMNQGATQTQVYDEPGPYLKTTIDNDGGANRLYENQDAVNESNL
eukprot:m.342162 g.342162  ORF g.342162 m.342162 type:complete len:353 (-) comp21034_c0_seq1:137-1195(-)